MTQFFIPFILSMQLSDFEYTLPPNLIASYPLVERSSSRLMKLDRAKGTITHGQFFDLVEWLNPGDLLVCNNTRVIPARFFGRKESGGRVEVLVERILDETTLLAQMRCSKKPKLFSYLFFDHDYSFQVVDIQERFFTLQCQNNQPVMDIIELIGKIPLPVYLKRPPTEMDVERYQTIYSKNKGSVAAPTAGLHFDKAIFSALETKGITIGYLTLHVGAGTFTPVRVSDIRTHKMHKEYIEISDTLCKQVAQTKKQGRRIVAVGTTTARGLETASRSGHIQPFIGDTDIFIYPGFQFFCIDALITNFHLPASTLLMLVSAFGGVVGVRKAYQAAISNQYRFYSYGDAMMII